MDLLGAGIHRISNDAYHADPCITPSLSRGIICELINKTPAHVFANSRRLNPKFRATSEDEDKFDIGTFSHALFLEGHDNAAVFQYKDWRKGEAQEDRKKAREAGKIPFLQHQYDRCCDMVEAAHRQLKESELGISDLYKEGKSEEVFIWKEIDEAKDVYQKGTGKILAETFCRIRSDWRSNNFSLAFDYKTTESADPNAFNSKIINMGYDIQDVFYRQGIRAAAKLEKNPQFRFFVQETKPPYLCSVIGLPPEYVEMAKQKVAAGLMLWRKCLATGEWPGYSKRTYFVEPKPWALAQWEEIYQNLGVEQ